jgi:hypothetical protein
VWNSEFTYIKEKFEDTKGQSEAVTRRRTNNAMAIRKRIKGQTTVYKILHRKLNIKQHKPH